MESWVPVAREDAIPSGSGRTVRAAGRLLAVFRDGEALFAIDDTCPHQGASLGEGTLHRGFVICPWHHWMYDVRTGACRGVPGVAVGCYPTRVRDGWIEVALPDEGSLGAGEKGKPG